MKFKYGMSGRVLSWLAALAVVPVFAWAQEPAGHVLMASGKAVRMDGEGQLTALLDRVPVYEGDTLQTAEGGMVQIKMIDNALLILQSKTSVTITRYQYDPAEPKANAVRIDLVEGRMRSVTGDLGQGNHDAFRLNTPIAAIGIRGTDFETTTTDQITRVRLNSGAVVFSPLGDDCSVATLGPCAGEGSLLLTEKLSSPVAELRASDGVPRLLDLPEYEDDQSSIRSEDEEQLSVEDKASKVVRQFSGNQSPVDGGDGSFEPIETPSDWQDQIDWGHWESVEGLDGKTVTELVAEGKEVTFRNQLFALFRDGFLSLGKGQATFGLQAAEAGVLSEGVYTPVVLADGSLMIDFDDRYFETGLEFVGGSVDGLSLQATGSVDGQGFLRSENGNMWVRGALSSDKTQAGYLFDHQLDESSSLQGATQWQVH